MRKPHSYILLLLLIFYGCTDKKSVETTPWGETLENGNDKVPPSENFSFADIQSNGEMIMLTMNGPDTYFNYHGKGMGTQFLLCQKFAQQIGVSLRVEVCKDTTEMLRKLKDGDGDIIAYQLAQDISGVRHCGYTIDSLHTSWAVNKNNPELADTLSRWYKPNMIAQIKKEEDYLFSSRSVTRHVYAPMLNASKGTISMYDGLFQKYAPIARWDWRLIAAQCYQESAFDKNAKSWAGAYGLMQIMPATANTVGLAMSEIYEPEANIASAVKYIALLNEKFRDIPNPNERRLYVLASYNGGFFHIRDAMALARKNGRNAYKWSDVSEFVLKLSQPEYFRDPVVKYGYMRGSETVTYVESICSRWAKYRGFANGRSISSFPSGNNIPHKSRHKNRFSK